MLHALFQHDIHEILRFTVFGVSIRYMLVFLIKANVICLVVRVFTALAKHLFYRSSVRNGKRVLDETKVAFIRQMVVAGIYIIGIAAFLSLVPGMEKISNSILASAGIMAMAVGLASQEALSNIVGGLFIVFSHPFKVGDFIKVDDGDVIGTVVEITLRHTIIRNIENRMILIPNSKINSSTIINSSYGDSSTCSFIEIGVSYNTQLDFAIQVMREEIMKSPLLIDHRTAEEKSKGIPQVIIKVINLGDSAITLRAWAWASTSANALNMKYDLLKSIKERFDAEHIEIPYPYYNQIVMKG